MGRWIILVIAMIAGAGALAHWAVGKARDQVWFGDPIHYARHMPPPAPADQLLLSLGFSPAEIRDGRRNIPRTFLMSLPEDLVDLENSRQRKQVFIATMLPLGLRVNEIIERDRSRLLRLKAKAENNRRLSDRESRWLERLGRRYGIKEDVLTQLGELDRRVRPIPVSLLLAQGAIESGWGTSRFAREGNAIFGQWTWSEADKGIIPKRRKSGAKHRIKAFDYLVQSVLGYAYNLNRNPAYERFRRARAEQADTGRIDSLVLAETLDRYSERGAAYVEDVKTVIRGNKLRVFDGVELNDSVRVAFNNPFSAP